MRLDVRVRHRRFDAALAAGADPWSSPQLMLRAAQLSARPERLRIAAALEDLVLLAAQDRPLSPYLRIRSPVVLEQRETLFDLAAQLRRPEPVGVAVVATLAWLAWDESSPVYVGGRAPAEIAVTAARCEYAVRSADDGP